MDHARVGFAALTEKLNAQRLSDRAAAAADDEAAGAPPTSAAASSSHRYRLLIPVSPAAPKQEAAAPKPR